MPRSVAASCSISLISHILVSQVTAEDARCFLQENRNIAFCCTDQKWHNQAPIVRAWDNVMMKKQNKRKVPKTVHVREFLCNAT